MKRYLNWVILTNACFVVLMLLPSIAYCQIGDPLGDPDAPVDGGLGILIAAGVGYGIKKARDSRKKNCNRVNNKEHLPF